MRPGRIQVGRLATLPRGVRGLLGGLAALVGALIVFRPTTALGVLAALIGAGLILAGALEWAAGRDAAAAAPRWRSASAALWLLAGVFVLLAPGLTVRVIALTVGVALLVNGVLQVVSGALRTADPDARVTSVLLGLAWLGFGLVALAWPDITLLAVAVSFGARLLIGGLLLLWQELRGAPAASADLSPGRPAPRWRRTVAAALALAVALGLASTSAWLRRGSSVQDEFYAPPRDVPGEAGRLIRAEPFDRGVPPDARGWRILYTTTDGDGRPTAASGLVVVPRGGSGDWPVISWSHGTTGFAEHCAPSLLPEPFSPGALLVLPQLIENGWAMVAADYPGLGTAGPHPYLIGVPNARAALDAVRAARQLTDAQLGPRTLAWGHSQGGGAALWAGALAAEYAPDVPLSGVAALAPAADPVALIENLATVRGGSVFASYALAGYTGRYPDVRWGDYLRPGAEGIVREFAGRCLSEPATAASVLVALGLSEDPEIFSRPPVEGALGERLRENIPPATIAAPLLIAQGGSDGIVPRPGQDAFVAGLCAAGQHLDYRVYAGRDHLPLVQPDSPLTADLFAWTAARFDGQPVSKGCIRAER